MEQPQNHRTDGAHLFHGALVATLCALVGCWTPTQRVIAVPAARGQATDRPLELDLPFGASPNDAVGASPNDAVVRIVGDVTCTGTLIADDRVLTAHHCVSARDAQGHVLDHDMSPQDIEIELGGDTISWGEVKVKAIVAPDCGYASGDGDIAILVLTRHLIGMPISTARLESAPERKDVLRVLGFGHCALTHDPVHRSPREAGMIESVASGHFEAQAAICPGDSGGPVYSYRSGEDLIGVVSASVMAGDARTLGRSIFTRVDVWPQLFSAAHEISLGASPSELPPYGDCRAHARATAPRSPAP